MLDVLMLDVLMLDVGGVNFQVKFYVGYNK